MKVLSDLDELPRGLAFAFALGVFDGVHRGHERVLSETVGAARRAQGRAVVMTFDPHPDEVLRGVAPPLLCDPQEKLAHLAAAGIGLTVVQRFDAAFAAQAPEEFLARLAAGRELRALVMTAETAFGRDRAGTLATAEKMSRQMGFELVRCPEIDVGGERISSTRLRGLLAAGRLAQVRRLLGRHYAVIGEVVGGDRRGRDLGYPTANLHFDRPVALPADGIYAVRASWGGPGPLRPTHRLDGVAALGLRPTFETDGPRTLEVHLFDFEGELYGRRLRVEFIRRQRGERRFRSAAALIRQMDRDAARARRILDGVR